MHGDGLTSLQWRDAKGAVTHEVQSNAVGPRRVRLEKRGNYVSMSIAASGEELHPAGGAAKIELTGEFHIGLAVSAHNTARIEKAAFSNVEIATPAPATGRTTLINTLETINIQSKDRRVVHVVVQPMRMEAPDGLQMVFLTYEKGAGDHPETKDVTLRLMDLKTRNIVVLARLFGGQGTINVASWSPNSRYIAFVSYQIVP